MEMKQVYEAALRLRSPELKPFLDWVRKERAETMEMLTAAPESSLQKLQGKAQCLGSVLRLVEDAQVHLERMK